MDSEAYPRTTTPPPSKKVVKQKQQQRDEEVDKKAMQEMMQWQLSVTRNLTELDNKVTAIHKAVVKTAQYQSTTFATVVELLKKIEKKQQKADIIVLEDLGIQLDEVVKKLDDVTEKMQLQQQPVGMEATPIPTLAVAATQPASTPTALPPLAPTAAPTLQPATPMPTFAPTTTPTPTLSAAVGEDGGKWKMLEQRVQQLESQTDMIASEVESMLHPQQQQEGGRDQYDDMAEHMASVHADVRNTTDNLGRLFSYLYRRDRLNQNVKLRGRFSAGQKLRIYVEEIPLAADALSHSCNNDDSVGSTVYHLT